MNLLRSISLAMMAAAASAPALSNASEGSNPQAVWKEIQALQKSPSIMPESEVLQPGSRTVDYYTTDLSNGLANLAIKKTSGIEKVRKYPNGSLLVKENYGKDKKLASVTAMLKVQGYDPADRNWVMAAYNPGGKVLAFGKVGSCIACHDMVHKQDLVFLPPPAQLLPVSTWKGFFPKQAISPMYAKLLQEHPKSIVR